jgi:hypothetical protein
MMIRHEENDDTENDDNTEPQHDMVCFFSIPIRQFTFRSASIGSDPFQLCRLSRRQQQQQQQVDQFLFYLQWRAHYHVANDNNDNSDDNDNESYTAIDVEFEMDDDFVTVEMARHPYFR